MSNLLSVIHDSDYISINDVIYAIHQHIGLDKDISVAEDILLSILNKNNPHPSSWGISKSWGLPIYQKINGLWQEIKENEHGLIEIKEKEAYRNHDRCHYFNNNYEVVGFIVSKIQEEREDDLPF